MPGIGVGLRRRRLMRPGVDARGGGAAAATAWYLAGGVAAGTCVAAYQPKGAADLATSYVNLANPGTYNAAPGTAPTFDTTTGWTFNGSSQYLDTAYTVPNVQARSFIIRFSDVAAADGVGCLCGVLVTTGITGWVIQPRKAVNTRSYMNGQALAIAGGLTGGVAAVAGAAAYLDGAAETGAIGWTAFAPFTTFYIGMARYNGGSLYRACKVQALAIYTGTLTAPQVAAITTAMQAL